MSTDFMNFKFTGKDLLQLIVLVVSLVGFYFTAERNIRSEILTADSQNKIEQKSLDNRITRLEVQEEAMRRDMSEVKLDVKEILKVVRRR